jgi:P pilus assembly protein, pilin FimA
MSKKMLSRILISGVLAAAAAPVLAVDTGTITFNGKIVADTCAIDINGATTNSAITFNNLSQTSFGADKKVGDKQPLALTITKCDSAIKNLNVTFAGTRISGYDDEVLEAAGTAKNLGVRLQPEGASTYVKFDGSVPDALTNKANGSSVVFNYTAEVIQVGADLPTVGDYSAQATYTLIYR